MATFWLLSCATIPRGVAISIGDDEDWEGNNDAFTCSVCRKVSIVSALLHQGRRTCPNPKCGKSVGWVRGGRLSGGDEGIRFRDF